MTKNIALHDAITLLDMFKKDNEGITFMEEWITEVTERLNQIVTEEA